MSALTALVVAALATGCNGDDDDAGVTTPSTPTVTAAGPSTPTPTAPPPTTPPPTTLAPTTPAPPTTTLEDLKAQIAADYERSAALRDELTRNPTLDGLDEKAALMVAPGSPAYEGFVGLIRELVERNERNLPGEPDLNSTTVELVELSPESPDVATVTACVGISDRRVDATGKTVGNERPFAARVKQQVQRTTDGWLPASANELIDGAEDTTECPTP